MVADGLHRRAKVLVSVEYRLFTHLVSADIWDVNAKESYKEFIHVRQPVPAGVEYPLSKYCLLIG